MVLHEASRFSGNKGSLGLSFLGEEILGVRCGLVSLVPTGVGFLCHFLLWDQMFPTSSSVARRGGQLKVTRSSPFHVPTSGYTCSEKEAHSSFLSSAPCPSQVTED